MHKVSVRAKMHKWRGKRMVFNHLTSGPEEAVRFATLTMLNPQNHQYRRRAPTSRSKRYNNLCLSSKPWHTETAKATKCEAFCMAVAGKKGLSLNFLRGRSTADAQTVCNVISKDTLLQLSCFPRPFAHVTCHLSKAHPSIPLLTQPLVSCQSKAATEGFVRHGVGRTGHHRLPQNMPREEIPFQELKHLDGCRILE